MKKLSIENLPEKIWSHLSQFLSQEDLDALSRTSKAINARIQLPLHENDYKSAIKSVTKVGAGFEKAWPFGRNHVLLQMANHTIALYHIPSQSIVRTTAAVKSRITAFLALSLNRLVIGTEKGAIQLWQLGCSNQTEFVTQLTAENTTAPIQSLTKYGKDQFISTDAKKSLRIWDVVTGKTVHENIFKEPILAVKVSEANSLTLLSTNFVSFKLCNYTVSSKEVSIISEFKSNGTINNLPIQRAIIYPTNKVQIFRTVNKAQSLNNVWVEELEPKPASRLPAPENTKESIATISSHGNRVCFFSPSDGTICRLEYKAPAITQDHQKISQVSALEMPSFQAVK